MSNIHFFKEGIRFRLNHRKQLQAWIRSAIRNAGFQITEINYIFCSNDYLLSLNKKFLDHHFYTDIITFDNSMEKKKISADIFISIEMVKSNAEKYNSSFKDELCRVMIHGILHLLGHHDKTKKEQEIMRKQEDKWLGKRNF